MPSDVTRVGGRIFYIHSNNGVNYRFFDQDENELKTLTVAGLANAYWVWRSGTPSADKYYVFWNDMPVARQGTWGYVSTAFSFSAPDGIGTGKTNTANILSVSETTYFPYSFWNYLVNTVRYTKVGGCNDWYCGSVSEQNKFRASGLTQWYGYYYNDFGPIGASNLNDLNTYQCYWWNNTNNQTWGKYARNITSGVCIPIRSF